MSERAGGRTNETNEMNETNETNEPNEPNERKNERICLPHSVCQLARFLKTHDGAARKPASGKKGEANLRRQLLRFVRLVQLLLSNLYLYTCAANFRRQRQRRPLFQRRLVWRAARRRPRSTASSQPGPTVMEPALIVCRGAMDLSLV